MEAELLKDCLGNISLEEVLKRDYKCFTKILKVERTAGSVVGDHYLSQIFRLEVHFEDDTRENVVKFIVKDGSKGLADFIIEIKGVEKEVLMYKEVVPFVNRLNSVAPECYFASENGSLLLEDLQEKGYLPVDRMNLLDFEHSKQALSTLALFHAATAKILEESPSNLDVICEEKLYLSSECMTRCFVQAACQGVLQALEQHPGKKFVPELEKPLETLWKDVLKALDVKEFVRVINHGDFWTTNILFKYSNGKPVHAKVLDFQFTRAASPAYDLHMFFATSVQPQVRESRFEELMQVYSDVLSARLGSLCCKQTSNREHLNKMMFMTRALGLMCAVSLTPVCLCDPKDPLEIAQMTREDFLEGFPRGNPYEKAYRQGRVLDHICSTLAFYKTRSYL